MAMDILNMNMVNDASIYLRSLLVGDAGFIDTLAGVYRLHGDNITFNLSQRFLIENLEEKLLIKNMAVQKYGYHEQEMTEWFNHNAYDTISYYLLNSAKDATDFKFMYHWALNHCPPIYNQLRNEFRTKLIKNNYYGSRYFERCSEDDSRISLSSSSKNPFTSSFGMSAYLSPILISQ